MTTRLVLFEGGDVTFVEAMLRELSAARRKFPDEEGVLTDAEWLAVLTEEVGEAAKAIQDEGDDNLREELAQVAAMAARWYASIPQGRVRPPWSERLQSAPVERFEPVRWGYSPGDEWEG